MFPDPGERLRVVVADDHPIWRDALARDLAAAGLDVVGTAGDGAVAVRVSAATRPDVLVCDLGLPVLSGVEAIRTVKARQPDVRVLVLSASGERGDVLEAVKAGASGYLVKSASLTDLVDAVVRTAAGETVYTPGLAALLLGEYQRLAAPGGKPSAPRLTPREREVLRLVAKGLTARQIASRLTLSHRTVSNHVQNVLTKLQLHNRVELTRYAIQSGLDDVAPAETPRRATPGV